MDKVIYQYILEILKERSFSKAASNLYIAQPSLSRAIINFENKLGVKIFDRSKNHIEITPAGEKIVSYIQMLQQLEKELVSDLELIKNANNRAINIGVISWKLPVFLPRVVPEFSARYPNIKVNLSINHSLKLESQLINDDLDIAIINGPIQNNSLKYLMLYSSNIVIIANSDSKLGKTFDLPGEKKDANKTIKMKDIANEDFVLLRNNTRIGQLSRNILHHYNIEPKNIIDVANVNSAIEMVSIGMGLSFIPDLFVKSEAIDKENICHFSIDKSSFKLPLLIVYKEDSMQNPNIKNFVDFVYNNYKI